jgi:peptidoglycan/xylan/chitin deacetylase (PgdA/CDA1 family)
MSDEEQKKRRHWLLDLIIILLIAVAVILADYLYIKWHSAPADLNIGQETISHETDAKDIGQLNLIDISAQKKVFLPILNFHHIDEPSSKLSSMARSYYLEPKQFEQIINELKTAGYLSIFTTEAVNYLSNKQLPEEKVVVITFDDGNEDFYTQAWPILKKYNFKSSVYIMTGVRGKNYLTEEQIKELAQSGFVEFGSHTVWHPYLTKLSQAEQLAELIDSKTYLEKLLNQVMPVICYPFGLYNNEVIAAAKQAGYQAGLTFDQDAWQDPENLYKLNRISVYPGLNVLKFLTKLKSEN